LILGGASWGRLGLAVFSAQAGRRTQSTMPTAAAQTTKPQCAPDAPQLGDASTVLSLEALAGIEDRNLLSGHILILLSRDYDLAQQCFLQSSRPLAALEMRRDLKHWAAALALARRLAPGAAAGIGRQHAAALELVGDWVGAKQHYQEVCMCVCVCVRARVPVCVVLRELWGRCEACSGCEG